LYQDNDSSYKWFYEDVKVRGKRKQLCKLGGICPSVLWVVMPLGHYTETRYCPIIHIIITYYYYYYYVYHHTIHYSKIHTVPERLQAYQRCLVTRHVQHNIIKSGIKKHCFELLSFKTSYAVERRQSSG